MRVKKSIVAGAYQLTLAILLLTLCIVSANAVDVTISATPDKNTVSINKTVNVSIEVSNTVPIGALQIDVCFDNAVLSAESFEGSVNLLEYNINNSAGKVTIGVISTTGIQNCTIGVITFRGLTEGQSSVTINVIDLEDPNNEPISNYTTNNCTIEVITPNLPDLVGILHVYDEFGNETTVIKKHKPGIWNGEYYDYPFVVLNVTFEIRNLNYPYAKVPNTFNILFSYKDKTATYEVSTDQLNDLNDDGVLYISDCSVIDATNISVKCYEFNVSVDSENTVSETNESNNNVTYLLEISQPDLVPILELPEDLVPGKLGLVVGAENIGGTWADNTTLKVIINGAELEYGVPILQPGEYWTKTIYYDFNEGVYNITVIADAYDNEWELNESNNVISEIINVGYFYANVTVQPEVNTVKLHDKFNISIIVNTSRTIDDMNIRLIYDASALSYIGYSSDYSLNIGQTWLGYSYESVNIHGENLNAVGTFVLANITFEVVTDIGKTVWLNLSGEATDIHGYLVKLNVTNASVATIEVTDIRPFVYASPRCTVGDEVPLYIWVIKYSTHWPENCSINVSVYNESGLVDVLYNETLEPTSWWYIWIPLKWNTSNMSIGDYTVRVEVFNDTITDNNVATVNVTLVPYEIDVWCLWYPWWEVEKDTTFWIVCYVNVTGMGTVKATINVPDGLLVWNGSEWSTQATIEKYIWWPGKWNSIWFMAKAVKVGEYGNGTPYEINITVVGRNGKCDTINSTIEKDPTDWVPDYKLRIKVPTITLYSVNTTVLNENESSKTMTFKTLDRDNVTTIEQHIRLVILSGQEGRLLSGLDYLVHYPYGCVEQTTSAMLGALHTDEYYRDKGVSYDRDKINGSVLRGVKRLAKGGAVGQLNNGAWMMWGGDPNAEGDLPYSMYAAYGLGRVAEDAVFGYLIKNNLTETHEYDPDVNKGKFNFNDTIAWFKSKQNANGGWSGHSTYWFMGGPVPATAWIMVAHYQLVNAGVLNETAKLWANESMANATKYLINAQNNDGGWGREPKDGRSNAFATAMAIWALKLYGTPSENVTVSDIENAIKRGINWLIEHQNADGSWNYYESGWYNWYGARSEATAYALIALNESRKMNESLAFTVLDSNNETIKNGMRFLVGVYTSKGSFGTTRATQAALHALAKIQVIETGDITLKVRIDGVIERDVTVNATNPKVVVELNETEIETIDNSGTPLDSKRLLHTVEVERISGVGVVIVTVENEQVVEKDDVVAGVDYSGYYIKTLSSSNVAGTTMVVRSLDSKIMTESTDRVTISAELPKDMVAGNIYNVKVRIDNNNASTMVSPIVEISFTNMKYVGNAKWLINGTEERQFTDVTCVYDSANNTLKLFPDIIPGNGFIDISFDAMPEGAGNATLDIKVTPMYADNVMFLSSATGLVKGYGNITLRLYYLNGTPAEANIIVDGKEQGVKTVIKAVEGTHKIKINKSGYVPIEFDVDVDAMDNKTYSVILVKPDELDEPMAIFGEGMDFATLNSSCMVLGDKFVEPNASVPAERVYTVSVGNTGKKIIAVRMPKIVRGNLWAWLNDSIKITCDDQTVTPKVVKVGNELVLLIAVNGSANVSMTFEGRRLGDVYKDSRINYKDAIAILQYAVSKNTSISRDMFMGWAVYGEVYKDGRVNYKDAIGILQYAVLKSTEFSKDLWI